MNTEDLKYYAKLKQKKYREEYGKYLIEGIHLIEECIKSKYYRKNISKIFIRSNFDNENLLKRLSNIEIIRLKSKEFDKLSETENSQGIIGVVDIERNKSKITANKICALENINDPGNLGTILRTCWWFGIDNIMISRDSVDLYNSKVIRASQGAIFNLSIHNGADLSNELTNLYEKGYKVLLTDLSAKFLIEKYNFDKKQKYVIVFGNEANGISDKIKSITSYDRIKISKYTECESLNVASSAAIVFYELTKNLRNS